MSKIRPTRPELDDRLSRLRREWFADARRQTAQEEDEAKRQRRSRQSDDGGADGISDIVSDMFSGGDDGSSD